jgi:signal transduction histidine kinase
VRCERVNFWVSDESILRRNAASPETVAGGITVSAFIREKCAVIRVQDHGLGRSPEQLGRIFDRFEQGGSRMGDHGLGLGLWITRQIVEKHSGTIVAESELDKDSVLPSKFRCQLVD